MKAFTCEMCGGHELKKEDGVFVCQHCHTKYAPEDARKLVLDGPIEIDNTKQLDNLFILARRARDDNDTEGARKYYEMILLEAPQNWEAAFYALFFSAKDSTVPDIPYTAQKAADGIDSVLALVHALDDADASRAALTEIVTRMDELAVLMFNVAQMKCKDELAKNPSSANATNNMVRRCDAALRMMYTLGDEIHRQFDGAFDSIAAVAWKSGVNMHLLLLPSLRRRAENTEVLGNYAAKIRRQEPDFALPDLQRRGCYIATAVYGSYDCPAVWTLRRYRDERLSKTALGRFAIRIYYAASPALAARLGHCKRLSASVRRMLDGKVSRLHKAGISGAPYRD